MLKISGSEMVLGLVVGVAGAVIGYLLSESDRRKLGRTPWGLPSLIWGLLWFLSWLIGLILYLFAHRAEVRRAAQGPGPSFGAYGTAAPGPLVAPRASDFPAYPRPADGADRAPAAPSAPAASMPPTAAGVPPGPGASAPPSWQPDPGGRYHYRWWTGTEWTSYVATDGQVVTDTSPDQRIGPY